MAAERAQAPALEMDPASDLDPEAASAVVRWDPAAVPRHRRCCAARTRPTPRLQCKVFVSPTGAVTDVKVIRSLDKVHGLDDLAIVTAKKWLFRPARFQGQPVAYIVIIQMEFNLR